jgi:uncharacterized delta-60 repeat protein
MGTSVVIVFPLAGVFEEAGMSKDLKTVLYKVVLISMLLGLSGFTIALAASGDLDTTFDGDGMVTTNLVPSNPGRADLAQDLALQPDGKIVAVGYSYEPSNSSQAWDFAVTRYNPNGSLDTTFSGDGRRIVKLGEFATARAAVVQPNGKIVVVGEVAGASGLDVAIVRFNSNGTLDTTFSGDGKQITDFGGVDNSAYAVALQANGKIIVTGEGLSGQTLDFVVYRYLSNGSLDPTFSGDGMVSFGFGAGRYDYPADLAIQSDGKIVVAGSSGLWITQEGPVSVFVGDFAIARLNPNGTLDTTFSGNGRQVTDFGSNEVADGLALQPDGKLVMVGRKTGTGTSSAVARFNPDGRLDPTFNGKGKRTFRIIPGQSSVAYDVVVSAVGKIIVVGSTANGPGLEDFAVARLNSNGTLDKTFSADGKVTIDFGGYDQGYAILSQPADGRYVLGGYTCDPPSCAFSLARVLP